MIQRVVATSRAVSFTRPLIVDGNAVIIIVTCTSLAGLGVQLTVAVEEGNDLDQWTLIGSSALIVLTVAPKTRSAVIAPLSSIGPPNNVSVGARFVRARLDVTVSTGLGTAVADVIVKTSQV